MDFLLFENGVRYGLSYLVIENETETYVLGRTLYAAWFTNSICFKSLEGMTCRRLPEKNALELLEQYRDIGEVSEFLDRYAVLPF